jgi:GST-like protein
MKEIPIMLDLYYAPTPNGWKITIMLEECGLPYQLKYLDFSRADQFSPEFLALNPNGKMPALVDHGATAGPLAIFESCAILLYLATRTGRFIPADEAGHSRAVQWLFWQAANLGPAGGQAKHFITYAPDDHYARQRFVDEYDRCLGVLNYHLARHDYLAGDEYSIADMASMPWVMSYRTLGFDLGDFPHLRRWFDGLKVRPALRRGIDVGKEFRAMGETADENTRNIMFNQTSALYRGKD